MIDNCYSFKELKEKFQWETTLNEIPKQIIYARRRGVEIEIAFKKGPTYFRIIKTDFDDEEIWKKHPSLSLNLEVSNKGNVRDYTTKAKIGYPDKTTGYQVIKRNKSQYQIHRLIMETFQPIEDSHLFYVDHIDGKRQNNNLSNLRWVKATENLLFRNKEWQNFGEIITKLVQKYGYEGTKDKLNTLLSENS